MTGLIILDIILLVLIAGAFAHFGRRSEIPSAMEEWGPPMEGPTARAAQSPQASLPIHTWAADRRMHGLQVTASVRTSSHAISSQGHASSAVVEVPVPDFQVNVDRRLPWFTLEAYRYGIDPVTEASALIRQLNLPAGFGVTSDDHPAVLALLQHPAVCRPLDQLILACRAYDHILIGARGSLLLCRELTPVPTERAAETLLDAMAALGHAFQLALDDTTPAGTLAGTPAPPDTPMESTPPADIDAPPPADIDAPPPLPEELGG